jgi:hypothetical protein
LDNEILAATPPETRLVSILSLTLPDEHYHYCYKAAFLA